MKVWITKYALTEGILEAEAEDHEDGSIRVKKMDILIISITKRGEIGIRLKKLLS